MSAATAQLERVWNSLVDPRYGTIKFFYEYPRVAGGSDVFVCSAQCADATYFNDLGGAKANDVAMTAGAGLTRTEAIWSTLGESIERYTARIDPAAVDPTRLVRATYAELGARAVDPASFILYSGEQYATPGFRFARPDRDVPRVWVDSVVLGTGATRLVPTQLVWLGTRCQTPQEILAQSQTSGLACGQRPVHAQLSGALEVIERDAFMAMWLLRYSPPRIVMDDAFLRQLDPRLRALLRHPGLRVTPLLITTDLQVPVVFVLIRTHERTQAAVGAAAHPDLRIALRKAVIEAHHSWTWVRHMPPMPTPEAAAIQSFEEHVRHYTTPLHQSNLDFLEEGETVRPEIGGVPSGRRALLAHVIDSLRHRGYRPLFVDMTTPDVAQLDLTVGRVLIPGLHPLAAGVANYTLDDRRLRRVADFWGRALPATLNLDPHPFP